MAEIQQHPTLGEIKHEPEIHVINGVRYEIWPHKASRGSQLAMRVAALMGEPVATFVTQNLGEIARWYEDRQKRVEVMSEHMSREEAESAWSEDLKYLLTKSGIELTRVIRIVTDAVVQDETGVLLKRAFEFTKRDGVWMIGEDYETAYAGKLGEQIKALTVIIGVNAWLDFLSSASVPEEADEAPESITPPSSELPE